MKNRFLSKACLLLCLWGMSAQTSVAQTLTVHTVGDSTMANQDEETSNKRGWSQMFQQFFNSEHVKINNRAKSGASSKSFYLETGYWNSVKTQVKQGDYVFIQFGHNDEKNNGLDGDEVIADLKEKGEDYSSVDYRGTTANGTYREYLRKYVNESRELGATPILLTPICRKFFSGNQVNRRGRHDLGEYFNAPESDQTYDYAYATKVIAEELNVPVIDLTTLTKNLYESYGIEACTNLIFCLADDKGNIADSTHPSPLGATLIARLCAQEMVRQGILANYVNADADLLVNPSESYDFGSAYIGQTLIKEFSIAGFDLSPEAGNITLNTSTGFSVATEKNSIYSSSVTLDYTDKNLDYSRFYVKCTITGKEATNGTLTITNPANTALTKIIALSAKGIDLSGGTEVSVLWPLTANTEYTLNGPAVIIDETFSNTYAKSYASPGSDTVWPVESGYQDGRKTQRCCIIGDKWPAGEIDEVSNRYMEFGIQANAGTKLDIDSIGLYVGGSGGNGVCCHIAYSTDRSFANCKYIYQASAMKNKQMVAVEAVPVVSLEEGEALYLRIYPWYNGEATGKTICLSDVYIHGYASQGSSEAKKYKLSAVATPEEAGTVNINPNLSEIAEGKTVELKAEANFGYKFTEWQDKDGNKLSTENPYTFAMAKDMDITAIFQTLNTYTLTVKKAGDGANWGTINIDPQPTEGKYLEGTSVTMAVKANPVTSFLYWDDMTSKETRNITITQDTVVTANFDVVPFIVAWDFNSAGDRQNRIADYAFSPDNKGVLNLYQKDGSTTAWTNSSKTFGGETYDCIRRWTGYDDIIAGTPRYYVATFDTEGYENVKVHCLIGADNACVNSIQKMQYSVDGKEYTDFATATLEGINKAWIPLEGTLPAEVIGQPVYIRWIADSESALTGTPTGTETEGFYMANLIVYADQIIVEDHDAPTLVTSNPTNGYDKASASGNIILQFNERVKKGNIKAVATLNGEELTPVFTNKSVSFAYRGLDYNTPCEFELPAGLITDMSDNSFGALTLHFSTMNRPLPTPRTFDAIVDQSLEISIPATEGSIGQYKTIQEAIDAAPDNSSRPWLIFVKAGYYNDLNHRSFPTGKNWYTTPGDPNSKETATGDASEDSRIVVVDKSNIHLIGENVDKVTIAQDRVAGSNSNDRSQAWYTVATGATLVVNADGFYMENITVDNEWWTKYTGTDSRGPQALALYINADRAALNNCKLRSYQDTYLTSSSNTTHRYDRQFLNNCFIEGAVDFIYGAGDVFFEGCTLNIVREKGGYIVAPNHPADTRWGYVFNNTKIKAPEKKEETTQCWLGRPWHENPKTVFLHTECHIQTYDSLWYEKMGGIPALWAVYDMVDADGNPMSTKSRRYYYYTENEKVIGGIAKNFLTDEEAAAYTIDNVFAGDKSNSNKGYWNPLPMIEKTATPILMTNEGKVTWEKDEYAICYVITVNGKVTAFTTDNSYTPTEGGTISVQSANEQGALSEPSEELNFTAVGIINQYNEEEQGETIIYDTLGRRIINPTEKGIYIINGKKVVFP